MAKFKKGDRIRVSVTENDFGLYQEGWTGTVDENDSDVPYVRFDNGKRIAVLEQDLALFAPSWDSLQVGDILIDSVGDEHRVLGVCGEMIFYSDGAVSHEYSDFYSTTDLQNRGWTIKDATTDEVTELSVGELEEKLNLKAGTLRVKKD